MVDEDSKATGNMPMIPYGRQSVDEEDILAVTAVLRSDWLTTGPAVSAFENALVDVVGTRHVIVVSSGTAALHASMHALGVGPGDEVIVPPMTFVATANAVVFQGAAPVFADVRRDDLLIDPEAVESRITSRTKAIIAVDYAGQPCDYATLRSIADRHNLAIVADSCHSLGATYKNQPVGSVARLSAFSFHPVKHIATGEGGAVATNDDALAESIRAFRNHGIVSDFRQREREGTWYYEMMELGFNYRLTDMQCALGRSQLRKLPQWIDRRRAIARRYNEAFSSVVAMQPLAVCPDRTHAYHLYVIRLVDSGPNRAVVFAALRAAGIGVNVHYIPVHLHPYYRKQFETGPGLCPVAEAAYERILSLPIFPAMSDSDIEHVIESVLNVVSCAYG